MKVPLPRSRRSFQVVAGEGVLTFCWNGQVSSCKDCKPLLIWSFISTAGCSVQLVEHAVGELK